MSSLFEAFIVLFVCFLPCEVGSSLSMKGYSVEGGGIASMYCYGSCYSQGGETNKEVWKCMFRAPKSMSG